MGEAEHREVAWSAMTECVKLEMSEAGGDWHDLPVNNPVEDRHVVGRIVGPVCSQFLVLPLHKTIGLREVELLFVPAVGIVRVTTVLVIDDQGLQLRGKLSPKRFLVGSPDLIDDVA
jgi:hypothetical protein